MATSSSSSSSPETEEEYDFVSDETLDGFSPPLEMNDTSPSLEQMMNSSSEDNSTPTTPDLSESSGSHQAPSESSSRGDSEIKETPTSEQPNKKNNIPENSSRPGQNYENRETLPNLYRLLDLRKDDSSNGGLVDKVIISQEALGKLCNVMAPGSFKSISDIDYDQLDKRVIKLVGCYGNNKLIAKLLMREKIITEETYSTLISAYPRRSNLNRLEYDLTPGIYLATLSNAVKCPKFGLVIHWSQEGCYEDTASSQKKKNLVNLHRYLTKLTHTQICLMSEDDLEKFDWKTDDETVNFEEDDSDDDFCRKFEVRGLQEEEENFRLSGGFTAPFPREMAQPRNQGPQDPGMRPLLVESTTNLSCFTRELTRETSYDQHGSQSYNLNELREFLHKKLYDSGYRLELAPSLGIDGLTLLLKGLKLEKYLDPLNIAIKEAEADFDNRHQSIYNSNVTIQKIGQKYLNEIYADFEHAYQDHIKKNEAAASNWRWPFTMFPSSSGSKNQNQSHNEEDEITKKEYNVIIQTFPEHPRKLETIIKNIDHNVWKSCKSRLIFAYDVAAKIFSKSNNNVIPKRQWQHYNKSASTAQRDLAYQIFKSNSAYDDHAMVLKAFADDGWDRKSFPLSKDQVATIQKESHQKATNTSDSKFISWLRKLNREYYMNTFRDHYIAWRKSFLTNIKKAVPTSQDILKGREKLDVELRKKKVAIQEWYFHDICKQLESQFAQGPLLRINNLSVSHQYTYYAYNIRFDEETTRPAQLRISFLQAQFDSGEIRELQADSEGFIPNPQIQSFNNAWFEIDRSTYVVRKVCQFEDQRYLVFLWNKQENRLEIYFEEAHNLSRSISTQKTLRILHPEENAFLAVNEPKGLIAIYNQSKGALNVYSFDENKATIYCRNANVQILQWYRNIAPKISHFFFINNTEELCFIEADGRGRLYNLITGQFRSSHVDFPRDSVKVISSPDGACIVAFVKTVNTTNKNTKPQEASHSSPLGNNEASSTSNASAGDSIGNQTEDTDSDAGESSTSQTDDESFVDDIDYKSCSSSQTQEELNETPANASQEHSETNETKESPEAITNATAYVYFSSSFGNPPSVTINLPEKMLSLENFQFTWVHKLQTHLISIEQDSHTQLPVIRSMLAKATVEKTQYRLQNQKGNKKLGKVKLFDPKSRQKDPTIVLGKDTNFRNIKTGQYLSVLNERQLIIEVISQTKLRVAAPFTSVMNYDTWLDFKIQPRAKVNSYIDVYASMYEKYSIECPIDRGRNNAPLSLIVVLDLPNPRDYNTPFQEYVSDMFVEFKNTNKKPVRLLDRFKTDVCIFDQLVLNSLQVKPDYKLGDWIITLSCLIPIQLGLARNNQFIPFRDGLQSEEIDQPNLDEGHIIGISKAITFGWYEGIFKHFGHYPVKVISSMGEQSCGKSYLLNHLAGTTFDGSAMRCTEGVWMSMVITDTIYVTLDFEGLKSLERTPQEDMFLTLLNASLSNMILFKNQFVINRELSTMFASFQDGATIFKRNERIFQAELCVIIKDVPKRDRSDIITEFQSKFAAIVAEEEENNFITRLYKGSLSILAWPLFNEPSFYTRLSYLKKSLDGQPAKYANAHMFLEHSKMIMAKLKARDWGELDGNLVKMRISALQRVMKTAISYGVESIDPEVEPLKNRNDGELIEDQEFRLCDISSSFEQTVPLMPDSRLMLFEENTLFIRLLDVLRIFFEERNEPREKSNDDTKWFSNFQEFLNFIINRRIVRVRQWFQLNTENYPQDSPEIMIGRLQLDQEINKLTQIWALCGQPCDQCRLQCIYNRDHGSKSSTSSTANPEDPDQQSTSNDSGQNTSPLRGSLKHNCATDHRCHFPCHFVESHLDEEVVPDCDYPAGHEGQHTCFQKRHLCLQPCTLIGKRNCQDKCYKEIGHEDEHMCQSRVHFCGEPCSLIATVRKGPQDNEVNTFEFKCPYFCTIPCEEEHTEHQCGDNRCPIECPIPGCQSLCQTDQHFHALSGSDIDHFCGQDHQCREECEAEGICQVLPEINEQEALYSNQHNQFRYTQYIQVSQRLLCYKRIPPNSFSHDGEHLHRESADHTCNVKCPFCGYYCTLSYGHIEREHSTQHGNMNLTKFIAEDDEFEYRGYRHNVGDGGDFALCNMFCRDLGRHRHIDYCQSSGEDEDQHHPHPPGAQHITEKISPNPERKKDFVSHSLLWERTGFKDPYSVMEQNIFDMCDHECSDEIHKNLDPTTGQPVKSYCELTILHNPMHPLDPTPEDYGYISGDGHYFKCPNPAAKAVAFHIIFVLDRSGSMSCSAQKPISGSPIEDRLRAKHNNRLGAVFNAVYTFMDTRINMLNLQNQSSGQLIDQDIVSIVMFNSWAEVACENRNQLQLDELLNIILPYSPSGGTNFQLGISKANELIDTYWDEKRTNILIFLSDGYGSVPSYDLEQMCQKNVLRSSPIYLHTIFFGGSEEDYGGKALKQMADIASQSLPSNTPQGALCCQFTHNIDEVQLVNHFTAIAVSLRTHKPTLFAD